MPKEEWGVKRLCPTTGKRFYDLGKSPIVSPYTGEVLTLDTGNKARSALKGDKPDPKAVKEEDEADIDVLEDDDDDSDVDLGDDVLEDDDDDDVSLDDIADVASDDEDS